MNISKTALDVKKQLKRFINQDTRKIEVDPDELAYWIAGLIDISQSVLKPFAITEDGHCYTWDPINEIWNRAQLKDIYAAVRRDPTV